MSYQTRLALLGLPLVDVKIGSSQNGVYRRGIARGWIAIGDIAFGAVALGGVAVGGIAIGGLALGGVALAGLAFGWCALGGMAAGWLAVGGGAFGWRAASGGLAMARDYALGGAAFARHANDAAAQAYIPGSAFFGWSHWILGYSRFLLVLAVLPGLMAVVRRLRHRAP
ncbi:MAG TPA: hypothetical protein VID04_14310 [Methylomirabilota bacterium]|jgi:hypothetical protein